MKTTLKINEVDCYSGNSWNYSPIATHPDTQHQILISQDDNEIVIGRKNTIADDDRGERIVLEIDITNETAQSWKECVNLKNQFKNEHCNTMEEFNTASIFNAPLKEELHAKLSDIHSLINMDIPLDQFIRLAIW